MSSFKLASVSIALAVLSSTAFAVDMEWNGLYRVEGVKVQKSEMTGDSNKAYMLHHLVLSPKIIATDQITIFSRFDIGNNAGFGANSQFGEFIGSGPGTAPAWSSNATARRQKDMNIQVSQAYLTWNQEFGQFFVGRMPLHFGLGTYNNSGTGLYDKTFTSRDIVGYKIYAGNFWFAPMIGKVNEGEPGAQDDVDDYMVQVNYNNADKKIELGLMFQSRVTSSNDNDAPIGAAGLFGGTGGAYGGGYRTKLWSLFLKRSFDSLSFGVDVNLLSGDSGVNLAGGSPQVKIASQSFVGEVTYKPEGASMHYRLLAGLVSGDDPATTDTYEGFILSQNFDVGYLLFNHPLGSNNFLRTGELRTVTDAASKHVDDEAVSNALFVSPQLKYIFSDKWDLDTTLVWARMQANPLANAGDVSRDLGYELDLGLNYKPIDRVHVGAIASGLLPGAAWKGGTNNYGNGFVYGGVVRLAVKF